MKEPFIQIKNLSKIYKTGGETLIAVNNISLDINEGEIITLLGPSGSGKSTLVNMIGGIDEADEGTISVDQCEITSLKSKELTDYRRESIGFVFQFYNLISNLTVYENVEAVADICKDAFDIDELLENLGISHLANHYPVELSGGQQQRVAIARALVKNPKILLCDEPTGALDYKSSLDILRLIKEINEKYNTTILIITHNISIADMCHRTVRISDGKITHDDVNENIISVDQVQW
ncbi:ABC transporter ATP-binding protein [Tissierella sp.]|uniref:ABC transporter ATP-binding protein n=1 Tax=Tissierella sp. TaxID=41274 RepID=UPI002863F090|nr:ABC transporter ATP-binding protein [Tissierella sp.]MDR7855182.1 ABC transporter ATP-binding protein [Tissierella sp.]